MERDRNGGKLVYALIGAGLVCAVGALSLLRRPEAPARSRRMSIPESSPASEAAAPEPSEDGASRMYSAVQPMSLGRFLGIVSEETPRALAEEFAYEFESDPELQAEWESARQDKQAPAAEFLAKVGGHPKLKALLAKYNGRPGFRATWERIASIEEIDRVLNDELPAAIKRAREAREARAAIGGRTAPAGAGAKGAGSAEAIASKLSTAGAGKAGPSGPGMSSSHAPAGGGAATSARLPDAAPAAGGGVRGAGPVSGGAGAGEQDAALLAALGTAGPDQDSIAFYLSLFARTDPGLRAALEAACDAAIAANSGCDIMTLCRRVGMGRCRQACAAAGTACTLVFPPDPPVVLAADPGGASGPPQSTHPHATGYGNSGEVYDNGAQVMTYGGQGPQVDGYYTGLVNNGDQVVGTFYTNQDGVSGGVVRDASDQVIYTYDNSGNVTTCPCP